MRNFQNLQTKNPINLSKLNQNNPSLSDFTEYYTRKSVNIVETFKWQKTLDHKGYTFSKSLAAFGGLGHFYFRKINLNYSMMTQFLECFRSPSRGFRPNYIVMDIMLSYKDRLILTPFEDIYNGEFELILQFWYDLMRYYSFLIRFKIDIIHELKDVKVKNTFESKYNIMPVSPIMEILDEFKRILQILKEFGYLRDPRLYDDCPTDHHHNSGRDPRFSLKGNRLDILWEIYGSELNYRKELLDHYIELTNQEIKEIPFIMVSRENIGLEDWMRVNQWKLPGLSIDEPKFLNTLVYLEERVIMSAKAVKGRTEEILKDMHSMRWQSLGMLVSCATLLNAIIGMYTNIHLTTQTEEQSDKEDAHYVGFSKSDLE